MIKKNTPEIKGLKPSEFMRHQHPDLFSDSETQDELLLTRPHLDHHLATLTNRSEELLFEHFCRQLLEVEICPNLLPHTGPTGGGDSKADSETYPVSSQISERWYVGEPETSSKDRWGFAFSAKADWKPKVRSDVNKIVETDRDYKRVFFVSSQYIKDKDRAEIEDELSKLHKIDVRILDRTWILEKVFQKNRIEIVTRTLQLDPVVTRPLRKEGAEDYRRRTELSELEKQIEDQSRYIGVPFQLIEDCLQAALLARGLELPRSDVDGRFLRARRLAKQHGLSRQVLRTSYHHAWTTYFWHDDALEFSELCNELFQVDGLDHSSDIELLSNLYMPLKSAVAQRFLTQEQAKLTERSQKFFDLVRKIESDSNTNSNSLWAKFLRINHQLQENLENLNLRNNLVLELITLLENARSFLDFPMMRALKVIEAIGPLVDDCESCEALFDKVVQITTERTSEKAAGKLQLQRGMRLLKAEKPYEAIRAFGKAQGLLAKAESHSSLIATLIGCGVALYSQGLLWSARAYFLTVVERITSCLQKENEFDPRVIPALRHLIWIELIFGRVPAVLAWMELLNLLERHPDVPKQTIEKHNEERVHQDAILGIHLLHTRNEDLAEIAFLPSVLGRLGLIASEGAAWFALGDLDSLRKERLIPGKETDSEIEEFYKTLLDQPASEDIRSFADYNISSRAKLSTKLLGCDLRVLADNNPVSIILGETVLAIVENLLATSLGAEIFPTKSELQIVIFIGQTQSKNSEYKIIIHDGEDVVEIKHNKNLFGDFTTFEDRSLLRKWLLELAMTIITRFSVVTNLDSYFDTLVKDEQALDRALTFSELWIVLDKLFGGNKKTTIRDWKTTADSSDNKVKRIVSWISTVETSSIEQKDSQKLRAGEGPVPEELLDKEKMRHDDMSVSCMIDINAWDEAKWQVIFPRKNGHEFHAAFASFS